MQHKFAMNKALEQKLIGLMEESHTKQQSPKAVLWMDLWARRSKIAAKWARTRAWAGWGFFRRKMECVGAGISGGGHHGPTRQGARLGGVGAPWTLVARCLPPAVFSVPKILKYSIKNHTKFVGHLEHFYFRDIFYCTDNSENREIILFFLYLFYKQKVKRGYRRLCLLVSSISWSLKGIH